MNKTSTLSIYSLCLGFKFVWLLLATISVPLIGFVSNVVCMFILSSFCRRLGYIKILFITSLSAIPILINIQSLISMNFQGYLMDFLLMIIPHPSGFQVSVLSLQIALTVGVILGLCFIINLEAMGIYYFSRWNWLLRKLPKNMW